MLRVSVGGESGEREIRVEHLNTVFSLCTYMYDTIFFIYSYM